VSSSLDFSLPLRLAGDVHFPAGKCIRHRAEPDADPASGPCPAPLDRLCMCIPQKQNASDVVRSTTLNVATLRIIFSSGEK
jgi:hypothetical protein